MHVGPRLPTELPGVGASAVGLRLLVTRRDEEWGAGSPAPANLLQAPPGEGRGPVPRGSHLGWSGRK